MSQEILLAAFHSLGLVAMCTLAFGSLQKRISAACPRRLAIGALFGLASICAMFQPFLVFEGYQIDSRDLFLALATAFGGLISTLVAAGLAGLARLMIGGPAQLEGIIMMPVICLLAGVWARRTRHQQRRHWSAWAALGAIVSTPLLIDMLMAGAMRIDVAVSRIGTDMITVFVFGKLFETELRRAHRERVLKRAASTDPLTGLPNRRALMEYVDKLDEQGRQDMALLIVDADHFKSINDSHGHDVGDQVLKSIANSLNGAIRKGDFAARFGGEEFAVLLHVAHQTDGLAVADRLRNALSSQHMISGKNLKVTVSIGGTRLPETAFDFDSVYARADAALYSAKRQGRNRAVFA